MYCSKCGCQNNEGVNFCKQCGAPLQNNNQQMNQQPMNNINNQQNVNYNSQNNGTYRLTLMRPSKFVGCLAKFKIFIDNNCVGTIKNGETVVLNVTPGSHIISFNKTMDQNINIVGDMSAEVDVFAPRKCGLKNIKDSSGLNTQNSDIYTASADNMTKSAKGPLIFSCACIAITFVLLFTIKMVVSPWVYFLPIGYTIVNMSSIQKSKQILNTKYGSLMALSVVSIIICIIGFVISSYLTMG